MRSKKHKYILICGFALLLIIAYCVAGTTINISVDIITIESEPDNYTEIMNILKYENNDINGSAVYVITTEYLLRKDKIEIFIPYIVSNIKSVPTAGNSDWSLEVGYVSYQWNGKKFVESNWINLGQSKITVTAGSNTLMHRMADEYCNPLEINISSDMLESNRPYSELIRVATYDSKVAENELAKCLITWDGKYLIQKDLFHPKVFSFSVKEESIYRNNI